MTTSFDYYIINDDYDLLNYVPSYTRERGRFVLKTKIKYTGCDESSSFYLPTEKSSGHGTDLPFFALGEPFVFQRTL